jgi:hypothetical protein
MQSGIYFASTWVKYVDQFGQNVRSTTLRSDFLDAQLYCLTPDMRKLDGFCSGTSCVYYHASCFPNLAAYAFVDAAYSYSCTRIDDLALLLCTFLQ